MLKPNFLDEEISNLQLLKLNSVCNAQCALTCSEVHTEHEALSWCKKCAAVELSWGRGADICTQPPFLPLSSASSSAFCACRVISLVLMDILVHEQASFMLATKIHQISLVYIQNPSSLSTMSILFLIIRLPLWSVRPSNGCFDLQFTRPTFREGVPTQPSGIWHTLGPFWAN